jgi:hypothetical protein
MVDWMTMFFSAIYESQQGVGGCFFSWMDIFGSVLFSS